MSSGSRKKAFKGQVHPTRMVKISKLDLDLSNPRMLSDATNQDDARRKLLQTTGDKCMELLRDMTESGELSSSDLPIVMPEGSRYVVLEGNRRLLCLQLWRNQKLLTKLGSTGEPYARRVELYVRRSRWEAPDSIKVVVAESREEVRGWIDKRHGYGGGGAGTVDWHSFQRDRRAAQEDPTKCSRRYAFLSFVLNELADDVDLQGEIWELVNSQYTVLDRVFGDPDIRDAIGISFVEGAVHLRHGLNETLPAIRRLISDLASGVENSRTLDKAAQRSTWADKLREVMPTKPGSPYRGRAPKSGGPTPSPSKPDESDSNGSQPDPSPKNESDGDKEKAAKPPLPRIFTSFDSSGYGLRIRRLFNAVSKLSVSNNPDICAVVLRVILETTCHQFLTIEASKSSIPNDLQKRISRALEVVDPDVKQALGQVETTPALRRIYRETNDLDTLKLLNYAVHSADRTLAPNDVMAIAERYEPLLVAMRDRLRQNQNL